MVKISPANTRDMRFRFHPWVGKMPWRRTWQPTAVILPGESHGQRSPVGYSPWGHKELDTTDDVAHRCEGERRDWKEWWCERDGEIDRDTVRDERVGGEIGCREGRT